MIVQYVSYDHVKSLKKLAVNLIIYYHYSQFNRNLAKTSLFNYSHSRNKSLYLLSWRLVIFCKLSKEITHRNNPTVNDILENSNHSVNLKVDTILYVKYNK